VRIGAPADDGERSREPGSWRIALLWALAIVVGLAAAYLAVSYLVALHLSAPVRRPVERTPADAGLEYRQVGFRSADGLELRAWWTPRQGSPRAALLVHGWGADKSSLYVIETARVYHEAGFNVLMLDLRAHGKSEGERVTLGYREVRDVQAALMWLEGCGFAPEKVVLHGWSMGGASILRAAPQTGVAAVVEEAAYADLPPLLRERLPEASGLPAFFNPGILLMGSLFLGIDPWAVRPGKEAGEISEEGVPFMIIHSRADAVVPFANAESLAAAYPKAEFWALEGYDHVEAYTHPQYGERLRSFLDEATSSVPDEGRGN
jgi:pimeloyl-ACP methyl ester carboxylesterase